MLIVEDEAPHSVRYRLLDSIRAFALDAMTDAGLADRARAAHATWFAEAATSSTEGVRSGRQAEYLSFARTERANIDAALTWGVAHDPSLALGIVNGFGWAWVVLGDSRGAQRILTALDAAGDVADPQDRARALLLAAWIEASTGHLDLARDHISVASDLAEQTGNPDLQARCSYYLAYVVSHHGEFRRALDLTDHSSAIYDGLDRPWDQAANWLFAARAAISAGDQERSVECADQVQRWLRVVDDPWLHVRGDAILGELARLQHRFDEAVLHLGRAAERSRQLGFQQTEAYQLTNLGRAQCQTGDYDAGTATLQLAIDKAQATGDVRLAALARVHLGRVLRAVGQVAQARMALEAATAWHLEAGGGEQAALGECLLAAMDAADQVPGAKERLVDILNRARRARMARSRSSPSTRSPASQPKPATRARPVTCVKTPIGAWQLPRTSSPAATEPTPTGYGGASRRPRAANADVARSRGVRVDRAEAPQVRRLRSSRQPPPQGPWLVGPGRHVRSEAGMRTGRS